METQKNNENKNSKQAILTNEVYDQLEKDREHFQKTIGGDAWSFSDVIIEYKKIINGLREATKDCLILKEPIKSRESKNYRTVLEDADDVLHYWLPDGTYDGYDQGCKREDD